MGTEAPEGDIPFSEWSEKLETTTNHWLPAYGFQQPSQLQEALLNQDYLNNDGLGQQGYVYLETIVEETSDDLRSDSEYSEVAGWPDTDSEAGSVIHIPNTIGQSSCNSGDWSGSERDLAVPKKRRRRLFNNDPGVNDDDDEDDNFLLPPVTSRSSSLLQFEQLEKQCDTVFRASASSEQFVHSPSIPSMTSSFSFDSLETSRWRFSGSPDSLNEASSLSSSCSSSSEIVSSDDDNITRSFSSRSGNESSMKSSLKSHRSFDSLVMCQEKEPREGLSGEFSQSLNNTVIISDDAEPAAPARGLYKTVECLTESVYPEMDEKPEPQPEKKQEKVRGQRSAENLSEDSGFGEHIPRMGSLRRASSSGVFTIVEHDDFTQEQDDFIQEQDDFGVEQDDFVAEHDDSSSSYGSAETTSEAKIADDEEREWDDVESKFNPSWQSAPDLLKLGAAQFEVTEGSEQNRSETEIDKRSVAVTSTTSLVSFTIKDDDEFLIVPENKSFKTEMNSRHPVVSTPNLYSEIDGEKEYELVFDPPKSPSNELFRAQSLKNTAFSSVSNPNLRKGRSRGSNIQITTSFINLTDSKSSIGGGSGKGVHFSNVVSEVSWKDRDDWSDEVDLDEREGEEKWRVREEKERKRRKEEEERKRVRDVPGSTTGVPPPGVPSRSTSGLQGPPVVNGTAMESHHKTKTGLGGFFQRFSLRRLSGRDKKKKPPPTTTKRDAVVKETVVREASPDVVIIPLHPPKSERRPQERLREPPPPPPRGGSVMSTGSKVGLLETDLDSPETSPSNKKARSLLNLGGPGRSVLASCPAPADNSAENRAKSMEFLLDKENQYAAKPPENELQKVGERVMSEHELRVQRSLQKLNVPDWYKSSTVPPQGFLLKRHSEGGGGGTPSGWQGLTSKTTSLSSLGSMHHATPRSPTSNLLSPSPTPSGHTFSRWSTSRLNSNPTSASTSPCGSARSSFNYRQPYLGWRSQERLSNPRTPAERLAAGLLSQTKQQPSVPNMNELSEVHSSIKEVTSAIVHYVSGSRADDRLSPAMGRHYDNSSSRSASPRGSNSRLCWLESSFVGNKPIDQPETPVSLTATPEHAKGSTDLYLDLTSTHRPNMAAVNGLEFPIPGVSISGASDGERSRPSPGSTTMEDVLDSLLGLAPASRSPSPSVAHRSCSDLTNHLAGSASSTGNEPIYAEVRRHSEGCNSGDQGRSRRVSFDMAVTEGEVVRCRYNKCNKTASLAEAKKTYKTCHNCTHVYCSRECRRAHWEKHRKTCLHSRVGALCRKVMSNIKEDEETLHHISLIARRGYLSKGRGAVKVLFSRPKNAEDFIAEGDKRLGEPSFVKWSDLQAEETGKEMHDELVRLCKAYNPDTRLVLYVVVCVVSEVPSTGGAVKWEMQMVSRCAKLKLAPGLNQNDGSKEGSEPETLILTSLPGARDQGTRKARQISFTNIQRHLRQRGISLRKQFPEVYQRLCAYVEGTERFVPVTIYPRDVASGKNFMCIIMPDAEPEKLELIPKDSAHVQTIDISIDPDSTV